VARYCYLNTEPNASKSYQTTPGEVQPAAGLLLVAGMVSSTSAQLVSYPLGLVRTRLQVRCTMHPLLGPPVSGSFWQRG
jgi:Mitochondrial carrier protein